MLWMYVRMWKLMNNKCQSNLEIPLNSSVTVSIQNHLPFAERQKNPLGPRGILGAKQGLLSLFAFAVYSTYISTLSALTPHGSVASSSAFCMTWLIVSLSDKISAKFLVPRTFRSVVAAKRRVEWLKTKVIGSWNKIFALSVYRQLTCNLLYYW